MSKPIDRDRQPSLRLAVILATLGALAGAPGAVAATFVPDFDGATFLPGAAIDHPYFPLDPTYQAVLAASGIDEEGEAFTEESQLSFGGPGRVILGVQTTVQRDLAFEDGLLVEDTFDYYAQDTDGNVWYMGEDVINYIYDDDDNLIETNNSSAWIAGENGASPGWIMPAVLEPGFSYFQEIAPGDAALDEAMIWAKGLTVEAGDVLFDDVIAMLETTSLDPEAREFKYYAPGVGLIRTEEGLDESFSNPELVFERVAVAVVPLPASLPLLLAVLAAFMGLKRLRSRAPGAI